MKGHQTVEGLTVRPFRNEDEGAVLELLTASLGPGPAGGRSTEFFRWKHHLNPFGPSFLWVAQAGGRIAGLRAFMQWRFVSGQRSFKAVRAVDTATHPDFQRMGVFSRLTREALPTLRDQVDLVFNTPNDRSGPGYLKLGWREVRRLRPSVRVRRPVRFVRGLGSLSGPDGSTAPGWWRPEVRALRAADALEDAEEVESLLREADRPVGELTTERTPSYLRWRFGAGSGLDYRAVREERRGRLVGLAIFRVRPRGRLWEGAVAEAIVSRGDRRVASRLLRRAAAAAGSDHVTSLFPTGSARSAAARRAGFLPGPARTRLVVNSLGHELDPDPTLRGSWALELGDVEVF